MPVLGAKFCGVEEAVKHSYSGYLVDGSKPSEILEGIDYIIDNKSTLTASSINWARTHDWNIIVKKYIELL